MKFEEARWRELGLWPRWSLRQAPVAQPASLLPEADWDGLEASVASCRQCPLHAGRRQAVLGTGDRNARWMFVGEGPGAEEDQQGEPFVGAAGRLLDQMLKATGLKRGEDVYIANVVKCRPPQNRTPSLDECNTCLPYLRRQIALVQPDIIVALGKVAAHALLGCEGALGTLRTRQHHYGDIPLVVTWHPAYLLRNPADKRKAWEDLCGARQRMSANPCTPHGGSGDTATT